ncbi:hypothetical protein BKA57DRAFT_316341 [Linnemannia elongata]|nr:hypothetical protein BKA57DRAFT_316341 [Linnemannia elongata]
MLSRPSPRILSSLPILQSFRSSQPEVADVCVAWAQVPLTHKLSFTSHSEKIICYFLYGKEINYPFSPPATLSVVLPFLTILCRPSPFSLYSSLFVYRFIFPLHLLLTYTHKYTHTYIIHDIHDVITPILYPGFQRPYNDEDRLDTMLSSVDESYEDFVEKFVETHELREYSALLDALSKTCQKLLGSTATIHPRGTHRVSHEYLTSDIRFDSIRYFECK